MRLLNPTSCSIAVLVAGLTTGAVSVFAISSGPEVPEPPKYATSTASLGDLTDRVSLSGNVAADAYWDVSGDGASLRSDPSTPTTGGSAGTKVRSLSVRIGSKVRKGQVLARLDRSVLALRVSAAEQALEEAKDARAEITATSGTITTTTTMGMGGGAAGGGGAGGSGAGATGQAAGTATTSATATGRSGAMAKADADAAPGATAPEVTAPGTTTPDETKPDETKPDATKPDTTKPDATKPTTGGGATTGTGAGAGGARAGAGPGAGAAQPQQQSATTTESAVAVVAAADAQVADARAALTSAKLDYADAVLRAPRTGTVTAVEITRGGRTPSGPAITLRAAGATMTLSVEEADVVGIRVGQPATITVGAIDATLTGSVVEIGGGSGGAAAGSVVTYPVTIDVTGRAPGLRDGMSADAVIETATRSQVLVVPAAAVKTTDVGSTVRVLRSGDRTRRVDVEVGLETDQGVEVLSGLEEGDVVVTGENATGTTTTQLPFGRGAGGFGGGAGGFGGAGRGQLPNRGGIAGGSAGGSR